MLEDLLEAIYSDNISRAAELIGQDKTLVSQKINTPKLYEGLISHWLYRGDIALHLAAAGYRVEIARILIDAGADVNSAFNMRRSTPLHYAADGYVISPEWNEANQVAMIELLLKCGANIRAQDKNGATPLHRAVRTRCAGAVKTLLKAGADPLVKNRPGSTPFHLAVQNTGRGGSGSTESKAAQIIIIREFFSRGVSPQTRDARGKSVIDWAASEEIKKLLSGSD